MLNDSKHNLVWRNGFAEYQSLNNKSINQSSVCYNTMYCVNCVAVQDVPVENTVTTRDSKESVQLSSLCDVCHGVFYLQAEYAQVEVFKTEMKGWGLRAVMDLPRSVKQKALISFDHSLCAYVCLCVNKHIYFFVH